MTLRLFFAYTLLALAGGPALTVAAARGALWEQVLVGAAVMGGATAVESWIEGFREKRSAEAAE